MIKETGPGRTVEDPPADDGPVVAFHLIAHERAGGWLGGVKIVPVIEIKGLQVGPKRPPNAAMTRPDVGPTEPAAARTAVK